MKVLAKEELGFVGGFFITYLSLPNPMTNNTSCQKRNEVNIHLILVDRKEDFHLNSID
jgi:hypothetical protein